MLLVDVDYAFCNQTWSTYGRQ